MHLELNLKTKWGNEKCENMAFVSKDELTFSQK